MVPSTSRWAIGLVVAWGTLFVSEQRASADDDVRVAQSSQAEFFESKIRPVLVEHCYACHNTSENAEGGLALDHREATSTGGDGGRLFTPGKPAESRLLAILRHEVDGLQMPQGGPRLDDAVIGDFERWIATGAYDPRDEPPDAESLAAIQSWESLLERRRAWWSFQAIVDPPVPTVPTDRPLDTSGTHPVDRFIEAKLADAGLRRNPPAEASALVRRLHFVLIGLPPTVEQASRWTARIDAAATADRDQVVESLIDELLASRQFGHRWARHWMDWIRYAESHGSEGDPTIENAWMYRDYLIRALNDDVPLDQLIREHVAGDLLKNPRLHPVDRFNESVIGTAHWRMVFHGFAPTDALEERVRFTDDQINAFTKAFLGLTVSCARCHDHKFDPISQADYYALFGVLSSCRPGRSTIDPLDDQDRHRQELTELKQHIKTGVASAWLRSLDALPQRMANKLGAGRDSVPDDSLLGLYQRLSQAIESAGAGAETIWQPLRNRHLVPDDQTAASQRLADWYRFEVGMTAGWNPPGEFVIATDGDAVIADIYPGGIYSHLISSKHAARLTSPTIRLDGDYEVWAHVIGDGGASIRYAVQNYPRSGTVYPVVSLKPNWHWQRFDLQYWNGDEIHIELAAAMDAPLLVSQQPRSWFGVRDVQVRRKGDREGDSQRDTADSGLAVLLRSQPDTPSSVGALDRMFKDSLGAAIQAWQRDELDDHQAFFLSRCLQEGLLVNRTANLPSIAEAVDRYRQLEAEILVPRRVPSLDEAAAIDQPLMIRGNHQTLGQPIPRRFLEAIDPTPYDTRAHTSQASIPAVSGRPQLADDLVRLDNPLTRRVMVNRIWHHLFGRGIVATPDNFGRLGESPTHPELLDWLACRLTDNQWSIKRMIRLIVTSQTWQADTTPQPDAREMDPDNRLWAHARLNRLEAESIRDAILSVSGAIDLSEFGPPVGGAVPRRSIYVGVRRNSLDPFLRVFDFPEPFTATGRRDATNVPAQSLMIMNARPMIEAANRWAEQILADPTLADDRQRIGTMFQAAVGRPAEAAEVERVLAFLEDSVRWHDQVRRELEQWDATAQQARQAMEQILAPARAKLASDRQLADGQEAVRSTVADSATPSPIRAWSFADGISDVLSGQPLTLHGDATLDQGRLRFQGQGHATTLPLDVDLQAKTLEAWVELDDFNQSGAGVMTIQTVDGNTFDSLVFGEKSPGQWLAGSNFFARTESFEGEIEREATTGPVHLVLVYEDNGHVTAYRNGRIYGKSYQSRGVQPYRAGQSMVSFGVRHLPAGGNRMLRGKIHQAKLYNVALTAEAVQQTYEVGGQFIGEAAVWERLSPSQRSAVERLRDELASAQKRHQELRASWNPNQRQAIWGEVAQALFALPEFIYVR